MINAILEKKLNLDSEVQGLAREKTRQLARIVNLQNEIALLPAELQNNLDNSNRALSDLKQKIAEIDARSSYLIRAPKSGTISNMQVKAGHYANLNKALLSLVPAGSKMQAKLLVPVRASGFIEKNQKIEIRYDAYPYQKFGLYRGEIQNISKSVVLPQDLVNSPIAETEPVYIVTASIEQNSISAYGQNIKLLSGMTFSADIVLKERSLLEWIFEPINSLKGRI